MNRNDDRDIFRTSANGIDPYAGTSSVGDATRRTPSEEREWTGQGHGYEHDARMGRGPYDDPNRQRRWENEGRGWSRPDWEREGRYPDMRYAEREYRGEAGSLTGGYDYSREAHDPRWRGQNEREDFWGRPRYEPHHGRSLGARIGDFFGTDEGYRSHRHHEPSLWEKVKGAFSGKGPKNYARADERIREDVCERLTYHPYIDASEIEVTVQAGEVTLTGYVDERRAKRLAEDVVDDVRGVKDVHNQIRIRPRDATPIAPGATSTTSNYPGTRR